MKISYFLKGIGITLFLLYSLLPALANETIQYELTKENVKSAMVLEIPKGVFSVEVELTAIEREKFLQLTKNNVEKRLQIIFSEQVVLSAIIKGKIDSGIIRIGKWSSEEQAMAFIKTLLPQYTKRR